MAIKLEGNSTKVLIEAAKGKTVEEYEKMAQKLEKHEGHELLMKYIKKSGKSIKDIAYDADFDESYLRKIYNNTRQNPQRDKLILIGYLGIGINLEELNLLLKRYGHAPLSPNNSERDKWIVYGIQNELDKNEIDKILENKKVKILDKEK